jgi:hypothetical protein
VSNIYFTGCDLHIPHKEWSGDEDERQNYLEMERWANHFRKNCLPCGVPHGGTTGQALVKESNKDCDVGWTTISGGGGGISVTSINLSGNMDIANNDGSGNIFIDPTANPSNPTVGGTAFTTTARVPGSTGNPPGVKFNFSQLVTSVLLITQNSSFTLPNVPRTGTERQFLLSHNTGNPTAWVPALWRWHGATPLAAMPDQLTMSTTAWVGFDSSHAGYNVITASILQDTGLTQTFQYQWTLVGIKYP